MWIICDILVSFLIRLSHGGLTHSSLAGFIGLKHSNNLEIYGDEVYDGRDEAVGIFLHRSTDDAVVYGEDIHENIDYRSISCPTADRWMLSNPFLITPIFIVVSATTFTICRTTVSLSWNR